MDYSLLLTSPSKVASLLLQNLISSCSLLEVAGPTSLAKDMRFFWQMVQVPSIHACLSAPFNGDCDLDDMVALRAPSTSFALSKRSILRASVSHCLCVRQPVLPASMGRSLRWSGWSHAGALTASRRFLSLLPVACNGLPHFLHI